MEGVWVVPLVGCGWFLKSGGYSTRDLLGPSTILTKLSHTHGYINWLSLVKKYANNFNLMFYTRTKKKRILCSASILQRNWDIKALSLPIMPYVYPGFSRPHPWGKCSHVSNIMTVIWYFSHVASRKLTEPAQVHTPVSVKYVELCASRAKTWAG